MLVIILSNILSEYFQFSFNLFQYINAMQLWCYILPLSKIVRIFRLNHDVILFCIYFEPYLLLSRKFQVFG